jgi:hypothetical protein
VTHFEKITREEIARRNYTEGPLRVLRWWRATGAGVAAAGTTLKQTASSGAMTLVQWARCCPGLECVALSSRAFCL